MPEQSMIRLRRKIMCSGAISGLFAYVVHLNHVCGGCKCVRLLSVGAMFYLWLTFMRFGYIGCSPPDMRICGNYGGYGGLL